MKRDFEMSNTTSRTTTYDSTPSSRSGSRCGTELDPFRADDAILDGTREKRYALTMFPYPSGDLHMGHAEVIALHDVIARYWWQRGYEVLNPMGLDSFGLNAENAAIRDNEHPATFTYANIETQYRVVQEVRASASTGAATAATPPTRSTTAGRSGCS